MKRFLKILKYILLSIAALLIVVLLFLGPVAKTVVQSIDQKVLGREIQMERMKINLLAGKVGIYGFHLKETDQTTDFVQFDTLQVRMKWRKLLRSEVNIPHIRLTAPDIHLAQDENGFNFNDIIERFSNDSNEKDTTPSNWKIGIYDIQLSDGKICFNDKVRQKEWHLKNLHLHVPGIYLEGENSTDAGLSFTLPNNGTLSTKVQYNMGTNDFEAALHIKRFALENVYPYLVDFMNIQHINGTFDGDIFAQGNLDNIMQSRIYGNLMLQNCQVSDGKEQEVLSLHKLDVAVNHILLEDNDFEIGHIYIDGLNSHFDNNKDGSSNFSQLFANNQENDKTGSDEEGEEKAAATNNQTEKPADKPKDGQDDKSTDKPTDSTAAQKEIRLLIKDFKVENSDFTYNDYQMEENFSFPLKNIRVKAENLQLQGENQLQLLAGLPDGGFAHVQWKGNISNYKSYQDLVINVKNLNMKRFSPYTVHYLAYPLDDGVFSFASKNRVEHSQLEGDNKIDIFNLSVGDKRKEVETDINIPLKAAVYILNDKDQKINLDIPVSGDLDNPEFSYMKIVWKTLSNLLVKVTVSPLKYTAGLLGMNEDELNEMKIDPLQFDFTSEQYDFLSKLAQLAKSDSNIVIEMTQQIDVNKAAHALALYNVKRDYYLLQHADEENYRLQLIDFEKIKAINEKDLDFVTFLNEKAGEEWEKASVQEKAEKCYPISQMRRELQQIASRRNNYMHFFLVKQSGMNERQLIIKTSDENSSENRYMIGSKLLFEEEEETLEETEQTQQQAEQ